MPPPPTKVNRCVTCNDPAPLTCTGCKDAKYCTPECQRTDWVTHKLICSSFKDFAIPPKPRMCRGLIFEAEKTKPRFIWVKFEVNDVEEMVPDLKDPVGGVAGLLSMENNPVRNRVLDDIVEGYYIHDFLYSDKPLNQAVRSAVAVSKKWHGLPLEQTAYGWKGNVLCLAGDGNYDSGPLSTYREVNSADFRNIIDFLCIYPARGTEHDSFKWPDRARKMKGVRIHCCGEEGIQYTATLYPQDHPFHTPVSSLGPELVCHQAPRIKSAEGDETLEAIDMNTSAIFSLVFGIAKEELEGRRQLDFHVVRRDGKAISPDEVEARCSELVRKTG